MKDPMYDPVKPKVYLMFVTETVATSVTVRNDENVFKSLGRRRKGKLPTSGTRVRQKPLKIPRITAIQTYESRILDNMTIYTTSSLVVEISTLTGKEKKCNTKKLSRSMPTI